MSKYNNADYRLAAFYFLFARDTDLGTWNVVRGVELYILKFQLFKWCDIILRYVYLVVGTFSHLAAATFCFFFFFV